MFPNLLEQLRVFRVVANCESFTEAAKRLNKTPSAISYSIAKLEDQLQLSLFDRSSYRPSLTEQGRSVYEDAELIQRRVDRFEARIGLMSASAATDLSIAVDKLFPRSVLVDVLSAFSEEFPHVSVRLQFGEAEPAINAVRNKECNLAIVSLDTRLTFSDIDISQIGATQNLLVASPAHPLAQTPDGFSLATLEHHRQIYQSLSSKHRAERSYLVHRTDIWIADSIDMQIELVKRNLGWAFIHYHFIWKDLRDGTLVKLKCKDIHDWNRPRFIMAWRVATPLTGPTERVLSLLHSNFSTAYPHDFD